MLTAALPSFAIVERANAQSAFDWKQAKGTKVEVNFGKHPSADIMQAHPEILYLNWYTAQKTPRWPGTPFPLAGQRFARLTDAQMDEAVKAAFGDHLPAQTLVPVPKLAIDPMLFEVEAVVILD